MISVDTQLTECVLTFTGGRKKIPGILYPDSGEYAKRTKFASWRAAIETSRSVEQLALQACLYYASLMLFWLFLAP